MFAESKLKEKDRIRASQRQWLQAALAVGIRLDAFPIVEWSLEGE